MEFMIYIIVFFLGWYFKGLYISWAISNFLKNYNKNLKTPNNVILKFEIKDDVIYAYDYELNTFLAYGKDLSEIKNELEKKYPNKNFSATKEELRKIGVNI